MASPLRETRRAFAGLLSLGKALSPHPVPCRQQCLLNERPACLAPTGPWKGALPERWGWGGHKHQREGLPGPCHAAIRLAHILNSKSKRRALPLTARGCLCVWTGACTQDPPGPSDEHFLSMRDLALDLSSEVQPGQSKWISPGISTGSAGPLRRAPSTWETENYQSSFIVLLGFEVM